MKIKDFIMEAVYPQGIYCICCGSIIDRTREYGLCDNCMKHFHWITGRTCAKCGKALPDEYSDEICYDCKLYGHVFSRGYSCVEYGLYERAVIMDLKYSDKPWIGKFAGRMMYDRLKFLEKQGDLPECDIIIPVPVHRLRLDSRGYNQAELMAKELGRLWEKPVRSSVLVRTAKTSAMKNLDVHSRRANIKGAFSVPDSCRFMIENKRILLVDDILTTGSTLDECARVLYNAGVANVDCYCFASGANRPPSGEL